MEIEKSIHLYHEINLDRTKPVKLFNKRVFYAFGIPPFTAGLTGLILLSVFFDSAVRNIPLFIFYVVISVGLFVAGLCLSIKAIAYDLRIAAMLKQPNFAACTIQVSEYHSDGRQDEAKPVEYKINVEFIGNGGGLQSKVVRGYIALSYVNHMKFWDHRKGQLKEPIVVYDRKGRYALAYDYTSKT